MENNSSSSTVDETVIVAKLIVTDKGAILVEEEDINFEFSGKDNLYIIRENGHYWRLSNALVISGKVFVERRGNEIVHHTYLCLQQRRERERAEAQEKRFSSQQKEIRAEYLSRKRLL